LSDLGLYSGWYSQLRDCAELVDSALTELASGASINKPHQKKLGEFLLEVAGSDQAKPDLTILQRWFRRHVGSAPEQLRTLGEKLLSTPDQTVPAELERIALRLDSQRAEVLANLRGR